MRIPVTLFFGLFVLCACSNENPPVNTAGASATGISANGGSAAGASASGASGKGAPDPGAAASTANGGKAGKSATNGGKGAAGKGGNGAGAAAGKGGKAATGAGGGTAKQRLAVTADWANQSLSIIDLAKIKEGATKKDILVGTVDMSAYVPGPLDVAIAPDGKTAIATVTGGWLSIFAGVASRDEIVVFVDLEQKKVTGDLNTGSGPMGVVITPDGKRAFVGQYSASYLSVIDIEKRTFDMVQTGSSFNEELAIDTTGTTGILSYGPAGDCVTFSVTDPAGTKGNTFGTTGLDAGGVAFFPGTKVAFIVQAPTTLTGNAGGYSVVDVSNPQAPVVKDIVRVAAAPTQYPVTAVPYRNSVVYPQTNTQTSKLTLVEMKLEGETAVEVQKIPVGDADNLAYGVSFDPVGKVVLLAVPGNHFIATVDLETKKAIKVPMDFTESGPTTIRVVP